jgi:hypothetical protein
MHLVGAGDIHKCDKNFLNYKQNGTLIRSDTPGVKKKTSYKHDDVVDIPSTGKSNKGHCDIYKHIEDFWGVEVVAASIKRIRKHESSS